MKRRVFIHTGDNWSIFRRTFITAKTRDIDEVALTSEMYVEGVFVDYENGMPVRLVEARRTKDTDENGNAKPRPDRIFCYLKTGNPTDVSTVILPFAKKLNIPVFGVYWYIPDVGDQQSMRFTVESIYPGKSMQERHYDADGIRVLFGGIKLNHMDYVDELNKTKCLEIEKYENAIKEIEETMEQVKSIDAELCERYEFFYLSGT